MFIIYFIIILNTVYIYKYYNKNIEYYVNTYSQLN